MSYVAVAQQASAERLGHLVGFAPLVPAVCPAIDPLVLPMNFKRSAELTIIRPTQARS